MTYETSDIKNDRRLEKYRHLDYDKRKERQDNTKVIENGDFTHAITFNTHRLLTEKQTTNLVFEFHRRFRRIVGEVIWMSFYECASGNSHIHSVAKLTEAQRAALTEMARRRGRVYPPPASSRQAYSSLK